MKFTGLLVSSFAGLAVATCPSGQSDGEEPQHQQAYGDSYSPSKHAEPYMQKVESTSTMISRFPLATGVKSTADNLTVSWNSTHHANTTSFHNSTNTTATTIYNATTPVVSSHPIGTGNASKTEYKYENTTTTNHGHTTPVAHSSSTTAEHHHHAERTTSNGYHSLATPMAYGENQAYDDESAPASYYSPPVNSITGWHSTTSAYTHYPTATGTSPANSHHFENTTMVETNNTISYTTTFRPEASKHIISATGSSGWPVQSANYTYSVGTAPPRTTLLTITKLASTNYGYGRETSSASHSTKTPSAPKGYLAAYGGA